jgi:hypothetical protein
MMTTQEFAEHLSALRLPPAEAAQLLGVSERSLRRWSEGESVPGPVEAALRAWRRLDERWLPWKPSSRPALESDAEQLRRLREHSVALDQLIREVEARGGPANPWTVDLIRQRATFGPAEVGFYRLQDGGFSPATYRRLDRAPSDRDTPEIQDACYCIAQSIARSNAASGSLHRIGGYVRLNAGSFAVGGTSRLTEEEADRRKAKIVALADELTMLGEAALNGAASYAQFEAILDGLHRLGFFPEIELVSDVARHMAPAPQPSSLSLSGQARSPTSGPSR